MKKLLLPIIVTLSKGIKIKADTDDGPLSFAQALSGSSTDLDQDQFDKIFIRPDGMNHILYTEH